MIRLCSSAMGLLAAACLVWAAPQEQTAPPDSTKAAETAEPADQHVKRAVFATSIAEREPVGEVTALNTSSDRVYFFTEIMGMAGKSITHRWIYNGENKGEVQFQIGGDRWRVYSSKTLAPEWTGTWTVDVVDGDGNKLYTGTLDYQAAP